MDGLERECFLSDEEERAHLTLTQNGLRVFVKYTSSGYFNLNGQCAIQPSISRTGIPLDNAPAENFSRSLKTHIVIVRKSK